MPRRRTLSVCVFAIVGACLGIILAVGQIVTGQAGGRSAQSFDQTLLPGVVATVNGWPIRGAALALELAASQDRSPDCYGTAFAHLIDEEMIFQAAEIAGRDATMQEADEYARALRYRAAAGDPAAQRLLDSVAADSGVSADRAGDQGVREGFRRRLTIVREYTNACGAAPAPTRGTSIKREADLAAVAVRDGRRADIVMPIRGGLGTPGTSCR